MEENEAFRLRDIVAGLWRRRWVVIAFVLLGAILAAGYYVTAGKSYEATSQVVVQAITGDPFGNARPQDSLNLVTERNLLLSTGVADTVKKQIESKATSDQLLDRVTVDNPEGSFTLNIAFKADEPKIARDGANSFAQAYLDRRQKTAQDRVARSTAQITTQITQLQSELAAALQAQDAALPGSTDRADAQAKVSSLNARILSLEQNRADLLTVDTTPGEVTRLASLPDGPAGTPKYVNALGIFLLVSLLGVVVALALDVLDPTVRSEDEMHRLVPHAAIEVLPMLKERDGPERRREAMARLAVRLGGATDGSSSSVQLASVTAHAPGLTTSDLVRTLIDAGRRTLVVWTGAIDECPAPAKLRSDDLGAVVRGSVVLHEALPSTTSDESWIAAASAADLSALLRPRATARLIDAAVAVGFDVIVFATPSPAHQAAALGVARSVEAVVMVSEDARPPRRAVLATANVLRDEDVMVGELVVGVIGRVLARFVRRPPRPSPTTESYRILFACSGGGHLAQLVKLRPWWEHHDRTWVTFDTADALSRLEGERIVLGHHPTTRNIPNLVRNLLLAVGYFRSERPDVIVSDGAGVAVPFFWLGRWFGCRTVYLEVYDRIDSQTMTAWLVRPVTDLFLVQWPEQLEVNPGSVMAGPVY